MSRFIQLTVLKAPGTPKESIHDILVNVDHITSVSAHHSGVGSFIKFDQPDWPASGLHVAESYAVVWVAIDP